MILTVAATPTRKHAERAATTVSETQLPLDRKMLRNCARQAYQASAGAIKFTSGGNRTSKFSYTYFRHTTIAKHPIGKLA
jgi:hypothetical protein